MTTNMGRIFGLLRVCSKIIILMSSYKSSKSIHNSHSMKLDATMNLRKAIRMSLSVIRMNINTKLMIILMFDTCLYYISHQDSFISDPLDYIYN